MQIRANRGKRYMRKTGLIGLVHKLPKTVQGLLLGISVLQRSQSYITKLPNMLPMLDKNHQQTPEFLAELAARGLFGAESFFINMGGTILHTLYFPPKNGKLICAFHGIKGNWLNNPTPPNPSPEDADYNPRYRMALLEEFAREGFGFLAFSMPSFNPSHGYASEENFRKACMVFASFTKKHALKNSINPDNIIVCGESFGGAMAAIFAAKMTEISYPPAVLSLIATFDSLIGVTHYEFPIFTEAELTNILKEKLDTTQELSKLDRHHTYINIVSATGDTVIPRACTINLINAAHGLGFNVLYHEVDGQHTTWNKKLVVSGKKLTHTAREKGVAIAAHQSVRDIEEILAMHHTQDS
jgi:hypothetical protein